MFSYIITTTTRPPLHSFRQLCTSVHRLRNVSQAVDQVTQTFEGGGVPEPQMSASHLVARVVGTRSIDKLGQLSHRDLSPHEGETFLEVGSSKVCSPNMPKS